jgi:hypothetical protein
MKLRLDRALSDRLEAASSEYGMTAAEIIRRSCRAAARANVALTKTRGGATSGSKVLTVDAGPDAEGRKGWWVRAAIAWHLDRQPPARPGFVPDLVLGRDYIVEDAQQ